MTCIGNLSLDPACQRAHAAWRCSGSQANGVWTYSPTDTFDRYSIGLEAGGLPVGDYVGVAVVDETFPELSIGRGDLAYVRQLMRTDTMIAYQFRVDTASTSTALLWVNGATRPVTLYQCGVYTANDWQALQSQTLTWFDKTSHPLFKQ